MEVQNVHPKEKIPPKIVSEVGLQTYLFLNISEGKIIQYATFKKSELKLSKGTHSN